MQTSKSVTDFGVCSSDDVFEELENVEEAICFIDRVLRNPGAKNPIFSQKRKQLIDAQQDLCDLLEEMYVRHEW